MKTFQILALTGLLFITWSATSCTLTTPSGSASVDPASAVALAKILAEK